MDQTPPRVSVVIPAYNRPAMLMEGLKSLMAQTVDCWEVIIIDDASNPPIPEDEVHQCTGGHARLIRNESSQGGAKGKTSGALAGHGKILAFLDDDDLYAPTYLERALHVLDTNPDIQVVFMGVSWFGSSAKWGDTAYQEAMGKLLNDAQGAEIEQGVIKFDEQLFPALLKRVPMAFQRPVVRREAFQQVGGFRNVIRWDGDWALRATMELHAALVTDGLYRQRADGQGFASNSEKYLEQLLCGADIKEHLILKAKTSGRFMSYMPLLNKAAATAWFEVAHHQHSTGYLRDAFKSWIKSQQHHLHLGRSRLLFKLALSQLLSVHKPRTGSKKN